jgi:S1-C subfamily serine protease
MRMVESTNPLVAFSDHIAELVERTVGSIVAVHGGGRSSASGIHWRSGIIVTAEEALERDEDIKVTLPGGRTIEATLTGRDPTTDVAVLRFQPDGLPIATTADASLRPGHVVLAIGNHEGTPIASLGIVTIAGPAWHSLRGGTIDSLIRLDLARVAARSPFRRRRSTVSSISSDSRPPPIVLQAPRRSVPSPFWQ